MAVRNSKSRGNYYDNAQKLIKWRIDQQERVILVPENELAQAKDNLTVQHLCNAEHRFHVQSTIPGSEPVGRDEMQVQWNKRVKEADKEPEKKQRVFEVLSDGSILVTVSASSTHIELAYRNRNKPNLTTTWEQLKRNLEWCLWKEKRL